MNQLNCPRCGALMNPQNSFCETCGLPAGPRAAAQYQVTPGRSPSVSSVDPGVRTRRQLIVGVVVSFVGVCSLGALLGKRQISSPSVNPQPSPTASGNQPITNWTPPDQSAGTPSNAAASSSNAQLPNANSSGNASSQQSSTVVSEASPSEICPYCHGSGRCAICGGNGKCYGCDGRGYNIDENGILRYCTICQGTGKCVSCHGSGICQVCNGTGHVTLAQLEPSTNTMPHSNTNTNDPMISGESSPNPINIQPYHFDKNGQIIPQ